MSPLLFQANERVTPIGADRDEARSVCSRSAVVVLDWMCNHIISTCAALTPQNSNTRNQNKLPHLSMNEQYFLVRLTHCCGTPCPPRLRCSSGAVVTAAHANISWCSVSQREETRAGDEEPESLPAVEGKVPRLQPATPALPPPALAPNGTRVMLNLALWRLWDVL